MSAVYAEGWERGSSPSPARPSAPARPVNKGGCPSPAPPYPRPPSELAAAAAPSLKPPEIYNVLFTGVGGQGVVTAAQLAARAAMLSGLDVRMYGSYGMAQRGGVVSAHLRLGQEVLSARIEKGEAHLLVALELTEAVRSSPFLSPDGALVASSGLVPIPGRMLRDPENLMDFLRKSFKNVLIIDAGELAGASGPWGINAVLLGAASAMPGFPITAGALEASIKTDFGRGATQVLKAFRAGRKAAGGRER